MEYIKNFINNHLIKNLIHNSLITYIKDKAEISFNEFTRKLEVENYYISSPVDGIDPHITIRYKNFKFVFYLSEDSDINKIDKIAKDINVIARAICDQNSEYKILIAETKSSAKLAIADKNNEILYYAYNLGSNTLENLKVNLRKLELLELK